jgi:hypothetical protein
MEGRMGKHTLAGKAGGGHNVAAQSGAGEKTSSQAVSRGGNAEKKSGGEPEKGPDNNKRLAFLEGQHVKLRDFLTIAAEDGVACMVADGEDEVDAAIRILAERNNALATALSDAGRLTSLVEALKAEAEGLEGELVAVRAFIGSHADFQIDLDEATSNMVRRFVETIQAENRALFERVDAAQSDPAAPLPSDGYAEAVAGEVPTISELARRSGLQLRFSDGSAFVGPVIGADAEAFIPAGPRGLYNQDVIFPAEGPPASVMAAWLLDGEKAVRCEMSGGLRIGGGAQAKIPAGHLIF